jgi:hypothetical protein
MKKGDFCKTCIFHPCPDCSKNENVIDCEIKEDTKTVICDFKESGALKAESHNR